MTAHARCERSGMMFMAGGWSPYTEDAGQPGANPLGDLPVTQGRGKGARAGTSRGCKARVRGRDGRSPGHVICRPVSPDSGRKGAPSPRLCVGAVTADPVTLQALPSPGGPDVQEQSQGGP